eukprot:TRINITY_DN10931_c0_g1_i2.p4 TRINITY_DN10931_c0_g1~~TRINITY_DN10931_c0_g1_i2.p4  ORF type:complete len:112 (+),score=18.16 TRINITY_DN10931_c0_g1_i2:1836-2171(+)
MEECLTKKATPLSHSNNNKRKHPGNNKRIKHDGKKKTKIVNIFDLLHRGLAAEVLVKAESAQHTTTPIMPFTSATDPHCEAVVAHEVADRRQCPPNIHQPCPFSSKFNPVC